MRAALLRLLALLVPAAVGLGTSTLLLVDYLRRTPVVCAEGGCGTVKQTVFAHPFGIPTPLFGVAAFASIGVLMMMRGAFVRRALMVLGSITAAVGLGFVVIQNRMGVYCVYCLTADACALLALGAVFVREAGGDPPTDTRVRGSASVLLGLAFFLPLLFASLKPAVVPEVIAEELAKAPPGRVAIVDFADFECPFCRMQHEVLEPVLEAHKDKVFVIRKLTPLSRIHPHALDAARAACCGERMGKGDAMANELFAAPVEELTREGCERLALKLGLDAAAFRACFDAPETEARIQSDYQEFEKARAKDDGLPLLWIGVEKYMGAQDDATLRDAVERAVARVGS